MAKLGLYLFFILITLFSLGCAQRLKVPINRLNTSESLGRGVGFEYQSASFSKGLLVFTDETVNGPVTMVTQNDRVFKADFSIVDNLDFFVQIPNQSASRAGVKIQILGEPKSKAKGGTHSLAITLTGGYTQDTFDGIYTIDLRADMRDIAIIHGYRLNDYLLIYDGVSVTDYAYDGKIKNATDLPGDEFEYTDDAILGAFIGFEAGVPSLSLGAEIGFQRVQWTNSEESNHIGAGTRFQVTF